MFSRCSTCDYYSCVPGDGPRDSPYFFIGEKPGREEENVGRPLIGRAGKEFNTNYLPLAGLSRSEIYLTNTVKCGGNDKPKPPEIAACSQHHLPGELDRQQPTHVFLMGGTACSLLDGTQYEIDLAKQHGIPFNGELFGHSAVIIPMYHPAGGLHNTRMMLPLLDDYRRLKKYLAGQWSAPVDNTPTDYKLTDTLSEFKDDLAAALTSDYIWLPSDTEDDGPRPWSLQYSFRPGHGRLILAVNKDLIAQFAKQIYPMFSGVSFHNAPHDIGTYERLGIPVPAGKFIDTQQEAFHMGNLPQGLKDLAFRLLGVRMQSWEDLVSKPSRDAYLLWLLDELGKERLNRVPVPVTRPQGPVKRLPPKRPSTKPPKPPKPPKMIFKPTMREKHLVHLHKHGSKPTYDLWSKGKEYLMTGAPIRSIAHAADDDFDAALTYACKDADMQGRLTTMLEHLRSVMEQSWAVEEEDIFT